MARNDRIAAARVVLALITCAMGMWYTYPMRYAPAPCFPGQKTVPRIVHQTHKSQAYIDANPLLKRAQDSWKRWDGWEHRFWSDAEADDFVRKTFGAKMHRIYRSLPIPVMKADLFRYLVVYAHGGVYADADTHCVSRPDFFRRCDKELVVAAEMDPNPFSPYLCQWVFAAPPRSEALKRVIDLVVERAKDGVFGSDINRG